VSVRVRGAAREIVRCCRSLWEIGLIAGSDGNVSLRLAPNRLLVTPRGVTKSELRVEDLIEVDLAGRRRKGCREATTELDLHLRIYRRREECGAVVHAHPRALLANHGAVTWGRNLAEARIRMESLEHGARILLAARVLGTVNHLTRAQMDVLERMRGTPSHGQIDHGY
jgi:L-fuculose-phosphate aldolase